MKLNLIHLGLALAGTSLAEELTYQEHYTRLCGTHSSYDGRVTKINGQDFKVHCDRVVPRGNHGYVVGVRTPEQCGQICTVSDCKGSVWSSDGSCFPVEDKHAPRSLSGPSDSVYLERVNTIEDCLTSGGSLPTTPNPALTTKGCPRDGATVVVQSRTWKAICKKYPYGTAYLTKKFANAQECIEYCASERGCTVVQQNKYDGFCTPTKSVSYLGNGDMYLRYEMAMTTWVEV